MIAHKLKTIFVHITKTAGSSIEVALNAVENSNTGAIDPATGEFVAVATGEEKHMSAAACKERVGDEIWNSYYKFTVVRNPFDRFHSLWWNGRYVGKRHNKTFMKFTEDVLHKTLSGRISSLMDGRLRIHQRFWPQVSFLKSTSGEIEMDQILRFESIKDDFAELSRKIGLPSEELPKVLVKNRNPLSRNHYSEDYDDAIAKLVADYYAPDIEAFGYELESR